MRAIFLLLLLSAGSVCAETTTSVPATAMPAAAVALQQQADVLIQPDNARVRGARIVWAAWIHEFYAKRSFRPAWTNAHTSQELQRAIEDSQIGRAHV